ncbi:LAFA_0F11188g1_1 [Lachancea sp. 'fantastica']|nr:LAFA_0F11188g1_1 [Lachancea sp. 'fantastica']
MLLAKTSCAEILQDPSRQPRVKALHLNNHISEVQELKSSSSHNNALNHPKKPSLANILAVSPDPDDNKVTQTPRSPSFDQHRTVSPPAPTEALESNLIPSPIRGHRHNHHQQHVAKFGFPPSKQPRSRSYKIPNHARKHSLDSLMTAVEAVETARPKPKQQNNSSDSEWQARLTHILRLKTDIVRSLESWSTTSAPLSAYGHNQCAFDSLSFEDIGVVIQRSEELASEARALLQLKHTGGQVGIRHEEPANYTYQSQHPTLLPGYNTIMGSSQRFENGAVPKAAAETTFTSPIVTSGMVLVNGAAYHSPTFGASAKNNSTTTPVNSIVKSGEAHNDSDITKPSTTSTPSRPTTSSTTSPLLDTPPNERPANAIRGMECVHCASTETPEWRRGPYGNRTVCNACGLFYCKIVKRFGIQKANLLMRYRRHTLPEDRRVPSHLFVPESFVEKLESDRSLDQNFSVL